MTETQYAYQSGLYNFSECFDRGHRGYCFQNEEKHTVKRVLYSMAQALHELGYMFDRFDYPIKYAAYGIANGDTSMEYLKSFVPFHREGFRFYGSEYREDALEEAKENMIKIADKNRMLLELIEMTGGLNAFDVRRFAGVSCDIVESSYVVFHLKNRFDGQLIDDNDPSIAEGMDNCLKATANTLDDDGFSFMIHSTSEGDMARYTKPYGTSMTNATEVISASAQRLRYKLQELEITPRLYFPDIGRDALENFKDPDYWATITEPLSDEASMMKKLLFSLQRQEITTPQGERFDNGFAGLIQSQGQVAFETFIDTAGDIMYSNLDNDSRHPENLPYFINNAKIQIMAPNESNLSYFEAAFDHIEGQMECIGNLVVKKDLKPLVAAL